MVLLLVLLFFYWGIFGFFDLKRTDFIKTELLFGIGIVIFFSFILFLVFGMGLTSFLNTEFNSTKLENKLVFSLTGVIWWLTVIFAPLISGKVTKFYLRKKK